jgi:DNA-binding response OmpR family regulator
LTILLIEDHDESRLALQRLLEQEGHAVVSTNCLEAARTAADGHRCDLVIGDIDLPDGDGCELMRTLRDTRGLRCIAVSGHADAEHDRRAADAGIRVRLPKPIQFTALLAAMDECMAVDAESSSAGCEGLATVPAMPCRTLVVEDDPASGRTLLALVKMLGHEAELAVTLVDALKKLEQFNPQCILLDVMLPDGTGTAVLTRVREKRLPAKVAVISALEPGEPFFDALVALKPDVVFRKPLAIERVHDWLAEQQEQSG